MQQIAQDIVSSPYVWTAGIGLVNAVLLITVPPQYSSVIVALNIFIAAVGSVVTGKDVRAQRNSDTKVG